MGILLTFAVALPGPAQEPLKSLTVDFEAPLYQSGTIHGQQGWVVDQGKAIISPGSGRFRSAGLVLMPSDPFAQARLSFMKKRVPDQQTTIELHLKAVAAGGEPDAETIDLDSARIALQQYLPNDPAAAVWVYHGDTKGGGKWLETAAWIPVNPITKETLDWHSFKVIQDPKTRSWALTIDGERIASGLGYQEEPLPDSPVLILMGHGSRQVVVDDLSVFTDPSASGSNQPENKPAATPFINPSLASKEEQSKLTSARDSDGDGLPDYWERQHGFDPFNDKDSNADPDKDGLVNRDEFALKLNPLGADRLKDHLPNPKTAVFNRIHFPVIRRGKVLDRIRPFSEQ